MEMDDFDKAAMHVRGLKSLDNKTMLRFYGLFKQATVGPCNTPKPGFWDMVGKSKWDAWNRLGNMDQNCAKLKYIELVREVDPKWDAELTPFVEKEQKTQSGILGGMSVSVSTMSYEEDPFVSDENKTIFDWCKEGNLKEVTKMIEKDSQNIHIKDEQGMTVLHWSCDRGFTDIVKLLLKKKANINDQDNEFQTPLHYAAVCEHMDIIKHLISEGADVSLQDDMGATALDVASSDAIRNLIQKEVSMK